MEALAAIEAAYFCTAQNGMFRISEDNKRIVVSCPSETGVSDIVQLCELLHTIIDKQPQFVTIDAHNLCRLDTAVLQAFLAFARELHRHEIPLRWEGCTIEVVHAVELLGLSEMLATGA